MVCAGSVGRARAAKLPEGTAVRVRLTANLVSSQATVGGRVDLEISQPVTLQGTVAIPAGAVAWGAVQVVKKGKSVYFDIEGVRLPNQQIVRLRCSAHKTNLAAKDQIKVEASVAGDAGAPKGTEFTAYLDQDLDVPGVPSAPAPAPPAVTPAPAASVAPAPKPSTPPAAPATASTAVVTPASAPQPATPAPTPAVTPAPVAAAPTPPAPQPQTAPKPAPAPPVPSGEYVRVNFVSDPDYAEIYIDEEYHGNTPAILKLPPGKHQVEFRIMGYKAQTQTLDLTSGGGFRDVRMTLTNLP